MRPPPFTAPPAGWKRWNASDSDAAFVQRLLANKSIDNMTSLDVQVKYPHLQRYNPANFVKNMQRLKEDMQMRDPAQFAAAQSADNKRGG
jgi:hypothetical protein